MPAPDRSLENDVGVGPSVLRIRMSNRLARIGVIIGATIVTSLIVYLAALAVYWFISAPELRMIPFSARKLSYSFWALGFLGTVALFLGISWFFSRLRSLRDESQDAIDLSGWGDKKHSTI